MDSQMEANCREWCRSHYWQLQEKRGWRYAFHESVMVRYYEEANLDTSLLEPLVEFLKGEAWRESFTVHNKPMDATGWKTTAVWYETRDGDVKKATKLKRTRIYHAIYKEGAQGGDGPYLMEDGCKWKVTHEFHWKVGSLPALPESASGVQYRLQGVARDDDTGLWNCVVERRETVQQDIAEYGTAKTVFEDRSEEQHLGVKQESVAGTGKPASVAGGVMVRRQLRKNEDCTTDVVNETVEEKPVTGAVEEVVETARGTRTTTVNRNQVQKAEIGSSVSGDNIAGKSARNELTDGGLWNQTVVRFALAVGRWIRRTCRKTLFLHEHAETVVVETDPGFTHEVEAGGGIVHEKSVQRNEEGGFDVETRTREEQSVPAAVVETRKHIDGVQVTTVNRAQATEASAAGLGIGESVRNEKTEGGRVDQTIVKASVEPVGRTGEACEQNALVHTHSRTEGMGRTAQGAEVQKVKGEIKSKRARLTERGAWEVTEETRTAKEAQASAKGGAEGRPMEVKSYRNKDEIDAGEPGVNEEIDVTVQRNEFDLLDGTVRKTVHMEKEAVTEGGSKLVREKRRVKINDKQVDRSKEVERGKVISLSSSPNEYGSATTTEIEETAVEDEEQHTWEDVQEDDKYITTWRRGIFVYVNQRGIKEPEGKWDQRSLSLSINRFGLYDYIWTVANFVGREAKEDRAGSEDEGGTKSDNETKVVKYYRKKDGKLYRREYTVHFDMCWGGSEKWLAKEMAERGGKKRGSIKGNNFPELGCISGMKGRIMYIYRGVDEGTEEEVT